MKSYPEWRNGAPNFSSNGLVLTVLLISLLTGCTPSHSGSPSMNTANAVSTRDHVGWAAGPSVQEEYAVRLKVLAGDLNHKPIEGVNVTAFFDGREIASGKLTGDGTIKIIVGQTKENPIETRPAPEIVTHNYAGVQTHEHYDIELVIEADGFDGTKTQVEVPRNVTSAPIEILLSPSDPY